MDLQDRSGHLEDLFICPKYAFYYLRFLKSITSCGVVQMYSNPASTSSLASFVVCAVDELYSSLSKVTICV